MGHQVRCLIFNAKAKTSFSIQGVVVDTSLGLVELNWFSMYTMQCHSFIYYIRTQSSKYDQIKIMGHLEKRHHRVFLSIQNLKQN